MADEISLGKALFGSRSDKAVPHATDVYAVAQADSSNGTVAVSPISGNVTAQDGCSTVVVSTDADIREGDVVHILASGGLAKSMTAIGTQGGGDRTRSEIEAAAQATQKVSDDMDAFEKSHKLTDSDITTTINGVKSDVTTLDTKVTGAVKDAGEALTKATETQQDVDGFKQTVESTYAKEADLTQEVADRKTAITQSESSITSEVAATYETKSDASTTYSTKTEVTQTATGLETKITAATTTANNAQTTATTANATATSANTTATAASTLASKISTYIRETTVGIEVGKVGAALKAVVNADGSFDVDDSSGNVLTRIADGLASFLGGLVKLTAYVKKFGDTYSLTLGDFHSVDGTSISCDTSDLKGASIAVQKDSGWDTTQQGVCLLSGGYLGLWDSDRKTMNETLVVPMNSVAKAITCGITEIDLNAAASGSMGAMSWKCFYLSGDYKLMLGRGAVNNISASNIGGSMYGTATINIPSGVFTTAPFYASGSATNLKAFSASMQGSWSATTVYFDLVQPWQGGSTLNAEQAFVMIVGK